MRPFLWAGKPVPCPRISISLMLIPVILQARGENKTVNKGIGERRALSVYVIFQLPVKIEPENF